MSVSVSLCFSHPYELLEALVSGQELLVEFDGLEVAAAELSVGIPHLIGVLARELQDKNTQRNERV